MSSRGEQRRAARAAKASAGSAGSGTARFYWVLGVVAVLGVVIVGYAVASKRLGRVATEPVKVSGLDNMTTLVKKAKGVTMGKPDAPVTIAEFGDFMCPLCRDFDLTIKPRLISKYVDTGKAKFTFYDFPLVSIHPNSFIAARAARCAEDQNKFWAYQDVVYRNQLQWSERESPTKYLLAYGDSVGLDGGKFAACVKSTAHADLVSAELRLAEDLGLDGTPTVMVSVGHGTPLEVKNVGSLAAIENEVDSLLAAHSGSGS